MTDHVKTGSIVRIIGPVLDVLFDEGTEPALKTLLVTQTEPPVHVEVVQHNAPGVVRSIALEPTSATSILNTLPARVVEIAADAHPAQLLVRLQVGNSPIVARVTRRSASALRLAPGLAVWVQIKAVALIG